jgi:hypothetical protein
VLEVKGGVHLPEQTMIRLHLRWNQFQPRFRLRREQERMLVLEVFVLGEQLHTHLMAQSWQCRGW